MRYNAWSEALFADDQGRTLRVVKMDKNTYDIYRWEESGPKTLGQMTWLGKTLGWQIAVNNQGHLFELTTPAPFETALETVLIFLGTPFPEDTERRYK